MLQKKEWECAVREQGREWECATREQRSEWECAAREQGRQFECAAREGVGMCCKEGSGNVLLGNKEVGMGFKGTRKGGMGKCKTGIKPSSLAAGACLEDSGRVSDDSLVMLQAVINLPLTSHWTHHVAVVVTHLVIT